MYSLELQADPIHDSSYATACRKWSVVQTDLNNAYKQGGKFAHSATPLCVRIFKVHTGGCWPDRRPSVRGIELGAIVECGFAGRAQTVSHNLTTAPDTKQRRT